MKIQNAVIALLILAASSVLAAITPTQSYTSDCSQAPVKRGITFVQNSSQVLQWTFNQGTTAKDLTDATLVTFSFTPTTRAWSQVCTGSVSSATGGVVQVVLTPTQLATNTTTLGAFDWILEVAGGTGTNLAFAYGKLTLVEDPTASVTSNFPTTTTTVDWSEIAAYTHTYDYGPVRPSTGISHTTNADGSITITAGWAAADTAATSALASTLTSAYQAADTAATSALSSTLISAYQAADADLSNHVYYAEQAGHATNADYATTSVKLQNHAAGDFAGAISSTSGDLLIAITPGGAVDPTPYDLSFHPNARLLITNLFAGAGTTGRVTSAAGDAGKHLKADGTWDDLSLTYLPRAGGTATAGSTFAWSGSTLSGIGTGTASNLNLSVIRPITDSTTGVVVQTQNGLTNVLVMDTTNKRVGIGTNAPASTMDIVAPSASLRVKGTTAGSGGGSVLNLDRGAASAQAGVKLRDSNGTELYYVGIPYSGGSATPDFIIALGNLGSSSAAGTERVRLVSATGNLGIGTNAPATLLHVVGDATVATNLTVSGIISNTAWDVENTAIAITNLPGWSAVSFGPWPYDITLTRFNARSWGSTSTVYLGTVADGVSIAAAPATTNAGPLVALTTNVYTTTFGGGATVSAGATVLIWCDASASDFLSGTNMVFPSFWFTKARL